MANNIKISKATVDRLLYKTTGQVVYWDSALKGFGMRIGQNTKAFIVQKKIAGKTVRVTIGIYGQITAEQARKQALVVLGEMTMGKNPVDKKIQDKARSVTLKEVFEDFLSTRKTLKPMTIYNYDNLMKVCFGDWFKKPIVNITKDMVEKRHEKIGKKKLLIPTANKKTRKAGGEAYANFAARVLRSVFNFAIGRYEDSKGQPLITDNPVRRLSQVRAWYKIKQRDDYIKPNDLPTFFDAVEGLESKTMGDYLLTLLFSGLRRGEAASLEWKQVDFKNMTLTIADTKNDEKLVLPLSDYLQSLLKRRYETARVNAFVFPGSGASGYINDPKKAIKSVREKLGYPLTIHGLRRTFITVADNLDLSWYAIKRLVNHKMSGDVTAGYIMKDVERLRKPMQKVTDFILRKAGRSKKAKVIKLHKGKQTG